MEDIINHLLKFLIGGIFGVAEFLSIALFFFIIWVINTFASEFIGGFLEAFTRLNKVTVYSISPYIPIIFIAYLLAYQDVSSLLYNPLEYSLTGFGAVFSSYFPRRFFFYYSSLCAFIFLTQKLKK